MYRTLVENLKKWKNSSRRKPLLLSGVRQCGKTYLLKQFGAENFENCMYVNFESNSKLARIFEYDFDVKRILRELELIAGSKANPGKTLLVFDEIQECPKAITSLKYFCEEMRELHVACAGSLLGVAIKRDKASFPVGKVNRLTMRPMSFWEFVLACGEENLLNVLSDWPVDRPIPELYSIPMSKLMKNYYIVGGMPEAVQTWLDTHDYAEVDSVQRDILHGYEDDFPKHAPLTEVPKIRWTWESVPIQLARDNNKFVFSHVKAGKRSADLENALQWLKDSGLIEILELVEKPELPLSSSADTTYFKVYMSDVGLLRAASNLDSSIVLDGGESCARYKGALAENYVLGELACLQIQPYFWRSGNTAEVDFLFEDRDGVVPVEVKSADNAQAKSYRQFCRKYAPRTGFKLSLKNIAENRCENTRTLNLPLYLTWNIKRYLK